MSRRWGISKLGSVILGYLAYSLLTAGFAYLFLTNTMPIIINEYISGTYSKSVLEQIAGELQGEIEHQNLSSEDYVELYRFGSHYPNAQMHIEKFGVLIFDSGREPDDSLVETGEEDPFDRQEGLVDFPIEFTDGEASLDIYLAAGAQFLTLTRFVSFAAGSVIFLVLFLFLLQNKLSYILRISSVVQDYEGGMTADRIEVVGRDELSFLAEHINHMADSLQGEMAEQERLGEQNAKLVSSLSHDIRTPLTAIISYLDIIQTRDNDPDANTRYLQVISAKAEQIKNLTDRLFDHAMDRETLSDGEFLRISVRVFVDELFYETAGLLEEEGYLVTASKQLGQDMEVEMNFFLFRRIWDNLYSNIQKYADRHFPIVITAKGTEDSLTFRLSNVTKAMMGEAVESNGIGLENCQAMARRLGGDFSYEVSGESFEANIILPAAGKKPG